VSLKYFVTPVFEQVFRGVVAIADYSTQIERERSDIFTDPGSCHAILCTAALCVRQDVCRLSYAANG